MNSVCRLCLSNIHIINNIFEMEIKQLPEIIRRCTEVEISQNDGLPSTVCEECIQRVVQFDLYRQHCQYSDNVIRKKYLKDLHEKSENDNKNLENVNSKLTAIRNFRNNKNTQNNVNGSDDSWSSSSDLDYDSVSDLNSNVEFSFTNKNSLELTNNSLYKKKCKMKKPKERDKLRLCKMGTSIKEIIGDNVYKCEICAEEFMLFFEYYDHQFVHNGKFVFKCSKCSEIFCSRQDLVQHDVQHKIPCKICEIEVLPKSMSAHLLLHTDVHKCLYCNTRHTSNAALEKHIKARHTGIKGFVCHICGKQSSCQSSMSRHMAYHSAERPHKCKYCDFSAKSINIIQVHTSRKHFAEKCVCEICAKLYKSQPSLNQHMKRIHSTRKHTCNICGKAFIERYNLKNHLKKHIGQRLHECKICHKEFFTVRQLKEHMHSHRQGCVNCPKCGKQFFYKKYFNKHVSKCTKPDDLTFKDS